MLRNKIIIKKKYRGKNVSEPYVSFYGQEKENHCQVW